MIERRYIQGIIIIMVLLVTGCEEIEDNETTLTQEEQEFLLEISRGQLESLFSEERYDYETLNYDMLEQTACFVTFYKEGKLRASKGYMIPYMDLPTCVLDNTISAATSDQRFPVLDQEEIDKIKIEIAVLDDHEKVNFDSPEELKQKLETTDGVIILQGRKTSTFLPYVWEQLPDKEEFLRELCIKGDMQPDCWKQPDIEVYTYDAFVFGEE